MRNFSSDSGAQLQFRNHDLGNAAVGADDRAGGEARRVGHQKQCGADDLGRVAGRCSAKCRAPAVVASMSHALLMSVRNGPGINVFTRTVGPNASASPSVNALSPALAAAYGSCRAAAAAIRWS